LLICSYEEKNINEFIYSMINEHLQSG